MTMNEFGILINTAKDILKAEANFYERFNRMACELLEGYKNCDKDIEVDEEKIALIKKILDLEEELEWNKSSFRLSSNKEAYLRCELQKYISKDELNSILHNAYCDYEQKEKERGYFV